MKSTPLELRLFSILCEEIGANHVNLLHNTETRCLSRGEVLFYLYKLK